MHKIKYLLGGQWENDEKGDLFVECKKLELVDDFKYLETFVKSSSDDFKHCKRLSWAACIKLRHLWINQGLSRKIKVLLFSSTVESILLYNSTTWALTEALEKSVNGCYSRLLSYTLDMNWKDHVPNKDVFQDLAPASTKIKERHLKFIGHCLRSYQSSTAICHLLWEPNTGGKLGEGRKMTYLKRILEDTQREKQHILGDVRDRAQWRTLRDYIIIIMVA
jgi:hypothetical protein